MPIDPFPYIAIRPKRLEFIYQKSPNGFIGRFHFLPNRPPVLQHKDDIFKIGAGSTIPIATTFEGFQFGGNKKWRRKYLYRMLIINRIFNGRSVALNIPPV